MKLGNLAVPAVLVVIILTIIIPVPESVLDFLLVINIALTLITMLNTVYLKNALELSSFPSLLVVVTLYRLALNIAATKLILGRGEAGRIIDGFGSFVAGGNPVVGFIMFIIIMVVNFLVITRGSERVAEVAARFTLDAMPGKQMAIDADLNSGLINEAEAKERRKLIQKEADFYGSMDGASKFVKNDAIAGIIITVVNIAGGFAMGMINGTGTFDEVLRKYTILTIGQGLVTQIPAVMISTATSIIVTRAGSDSELSYDLLKQVFNNAKAMYIASAACAAMSFFLPRVPFLLMAALLAYLGYTLKRIETEAQERERSAVSEVEVEDLRRPENVMSILQVDPIELEFGYGIIPLADVNQGGDLLDRVVMIRRQLALELGVVIPIIRLRDNIQLSPNEYVIKIKGVEVARGEIIPEHYLAMNPGSADAEIEGIATEEPAFGLPAVWIDENQREEAEIAGYTVVDPPSVISTHLTEVLKRHVHELISRQDVQKLVDNIKENYPAIVEELVPKLMTIGEIQKVLVNLLREGVSIRDMVTILETLADFAPVTHDTDMLTEYVRQALGRAITKKYIEEGRTKVVTLDPKLEKIVMDSVQKTEYGSYLSIDPGVSSAILENLSKQVEKVLRLGQQPIILASPIVRLYFKRLTEQAIPGLVVLSYNELDPAVEIQSVGVVSI